MPPPNSCICLINQSNLISLDAHRVAHKMRENVHIVFVPGPIGMRMCVYSTFRIPISVTNNSQNWGVKWFPEIWKKTAHTLILTLTQREVYASENEFNSDFTVCIKLRLHKNQSRKLLRQNKRTNKYRMENLTRQQIKLVIWHWQKPKLVMDLWIFFIFIDSLLS